MFKQLDGWKLFRGLASLMLVGYILFPAFKPALAIGNPNGNPPGNNGTVKINSTDIDQNNENGNDPHVGCTFQVDWTGFDEQVVNSEVTFDFQEPTGTDQILTDTVTLTDGSATKSYDLTDELQGVEPNSDQGWHVKLTVNTEGSIGADVKHKVFWVNDCGGQGGVESASLTIVKDADPDDAQDFSFTGDLGSFSLDDDGDNTNTLSNSQTFSELTPGTYTVAEGTLDNWTLDGVECTGVSNFEVNSNAVTVTLANGDAGTCTFTNSKGAVLGEDIEKGEILGAATELPGTGAGDNAIFLASLASMFAYLYAIKRYGLEL